MFFQPGDPDNPAGPNASGKATLTRLLAQSIFPTEGEIFTPQHLRVLRVHLRTP